MSTATVQPAAMSIEQAVRFVALAGAVAPKLANQARQAIEEGTSHDVDVRAHVFGVLVKEIGSSSSVAQRSAAVDLYRPELIHELLRRLKITPQQLGRALRAAVKAEPMGAGADDLAACFDRVRAERVEQLGPVTVTVPGRAGALRTGGLNFEFI